MEFTFWQTVGVVLLAIGVGYGFKEIIEAQQTIIAKLDKIISRSGYDD